MIIELKILGGNSCQLNVPDDARVKYLKDMIEKQNKILKSQQKLVFKGKTLSDDKYLSDYGITGGSKIHLVVKKNTSASGDASKSADHHKESPMYDVDDFWKTLKCILSKRFTASEVEDIIQQYHMDYKKILTTISLDDVERIATRKLNST